MTRWYFTSIASGFVPTEIANTFATDTTLSSNVFELNTTKGGTASTISRAETSTSSAWEVLLGRWVTPPFLQGGDWPAGAAGVQSIDIVVGQQESSTSANMFLTITWGIVKADGTLRTAADGGTDINNWLVGTEMPTTATGRAGGNLTQGSAVNGCQAGDRVVVELAYNAQNTSSSSFTGTIHYGGTGTTDLTDGSTSVTTRPGWTEWVGTTSVDGFWVPPPTRRLFLPF